MFERFHQERAIMMADSDARLLEVRRQGEEERARFEDQVRRREMENQRVHRVMHAAHKNAYESQNGARLANTVGPRAGTNCWSRSSSSDDSPEYAVSPGQSQNASPSRQAKLRPPANPEGEFQGDDRIEDLMRESLAMEGCTPPKHRRYADEVGSKTGSLRGSPQIAAQPPRMGIIKRVPRERGVGGPPIFGVGQCTQRHPQHLVTICRLKSWSG